MKNFIYYIISFGPVIIYNIYFFSTKELNSGISINSAIISFMLWIIGTSIGKKIKEKG